MPIRRLFGLLVCALSLFSVPAVAQTVAFVHGTDAETSVYLEETEARVRVTDPAADASPAVLDTVPVTVTTALSGDSEVLELRETDRDSGVFEGRIKLVRNATPSQAGILETGFAAGPPAVFDTLTAQYGAATATAEMEAVLIQILDGHGRPAHSLSNGDWVHVRLEDHVRADDFGMRDTVSVLVQNPDMGDGEVLTLTETARRTGVFEGRIRHLTPLSPSGDGVVGGYPFHQILAVYDVTGYPEDAEVSVTVVGSRVEVLGADGRPTLLVPESSPLRLRVTNRTVEAFPGVDVADVVLHSQITGDDETVILTETGPATGIFEGTVPATVFGPAQDGDGTLTTGEILGPPHSFDVVQISYTDDFSYSGTVWTSVGTYASETRFTDAEGRDVETYAAGFPAWVRVEDHNANQPAVVDTIQATVESLTQGDSETLTLTETGQDTAVFSGSMPVELASGTSYQDGVVQAQAEDTLRVLHGDALGLTASGDLARLRTSRLQFIDADGRPVAEVLENGRARVRLEQSDCNTSPYWIDSCQVIFTSRIHADEEEVWIEETGDDTGVFVGEIFTPFLYTAWTYNGVLELGNSGSPEYLADEVTATAGSNSARVPAVAFTLRFIRANGEDAETFSPGEAVWLRLEDHAINDPYSTQTEHVLVRVFGSFEIEPMQLTETGPGTGVFVGSLPSRFSASPAYDGTLDVEIGSRLLVDWNHFNDSREARDEAVVTGTGTPPPPVDSPVTFRDAYGNPAESYTQGTVAYVRVEDGEANLLPTHYDFVQATLSCAATGDVESVYLRETTRDSGVFEGSAVLDATGPNWNGGLYCLPGDEIEAVYGEFSDRATIRYSSAMFIDEAGEPTGEVLENGVARLRVVGSSAGSSITVTVTSSRGDDQEHVTLTETFSGSQVYEGSVQLSFVPPGNGSPNSGVLDASNSGAPDYLGDELTVVYQDAEGTAVTIPSRVSFFDSYGRTVSTFAVGERVGVRVQDHNLKNPMFREQIQVLVHEVGSGDAETAYLMETGYDTDVYEGTLDTEDAPVASGDGTLQVAPGEVIAAERLNENTPHPTVAQATMAGASVVFVDAEGRPAEAYYERTMAYVRVSDTSASGSITATLQSFLGGDSEPLTLTETGPSTSVFVGSIPLLPGGANPHNGYLETSQFSGPPHEYDVLTASYESIDGTVSATVGMTGSRTWFVDAYGNETDGYTAGTTAYVRVEDHVAAGMPGYYDIKEVTLYAPATGDSETVTLRETTRESGIFEGSVQLEKEDHPPTPSPNDGRLQSMPGEVIEVVNDEYIGDGTSSDTALIRFASAEFVDEAGEPTNEVLENGVARLRVSSASPGSSITVTVTSSRGDDQESVTLTETFSGSQVYEGTVQLSFVPPGNGSPNSGVLDASNSGAPDYLGDELTVTYQDAEGTAVTIPSQVSFFDSYGRTASTFAVGERVGVRVQDHNLANPMIREQIQVLVREVGSGDAESVYLTETGYDTDVYEGTLATADGSPVPGDNTLQVEPGRVIVAERLNENSPYPTVAHATMAGAAVVFVDAEGRPAQLYYERTRAYVRVSDTFASGSITVTLQSFLGGDSESLTLTETGPSVFEGSIPLTTGGGGGNPNNGYLETGQYSGPPHEYDTLTASYESIAGTVSGTAGMIGSRTWFVDAYGNETDSYTAGTTAYIRVEDHVAAGMPGYYDIKEVTLYAPATGDSETVTLRETTRESGIFEGSVQLEKEDQPPTPSPNDGRLQSMPGEEIEVVNDEYAGDGTSSDTALIRSASAEFVDEAGEPTNEVLENGVARLRVVASSPGSSITVTVTSSHGEDQEHVTLTETFSGSQVYEGTVQLSFVPPGNGSTNSGVLDASNSGAPDYLGDGLTVTYQDAEGTAVTIPSRVSFFDSYGRTVSTFAVGERVGVRVQDHNLRNPMIREQIQVFVHEVGSGDAQSVYLTETGYDTDVYEGTLATEDGPPVSWDGKLQVAPGRTIAAERLNENSPYPTVAHATMAGASVVFVDVEGRPAQLYYERTRAYVRVSDTFASGSVTATLQSFLGGDSESFTLTETGPSVFEGSIPLTTGGGGANPNNGYLETGQYSGPPHEYDTLTASYESIAGTVSGTAGMIGSRTSFVDAFGNETDSYTAGTTAHIRVEDHIAGSMPGSYDVKEVTLYAPATGDTETVTLRETTRESGIFEGSVSLEKEDQPPTPSPNDGRLQSMPGEEIEVINDEYSGDGRSSDTALIRSASAEFVDEAGEPTNEVLENGVARLRVSSASPGSSITVTVTSSHGEDQEHVTLTETISGSQVYEGSVQLSFVPPGNGSTNSGVLDASNSGAPDYLGDGLTVTYQDAEGTAVTIPSRVSFFDSFGRTTTTFAVGERVGVRVQDHNLRNPMIREQIQVLVHEVGSGDAQSVYLTETGYDTDVYEGTLATADGPPVSGDGTLQVAPGRVIAAERLNENTPYPTVAQATMAGASVAFVDAEGRPAELYYERTMAYVRVSDTFASGSITVTLQSFLGGDSESLTLTETGPSMFEGSIPLSLNSGNPDNGYLETGQYSGPPHEYDTLTASYESIAGTVSGTVGVIGSRTWFVDAYGNETESYTAGTTAYIRVEDHIAGSMPGSYDVKEVTLYAPATGDTETVTLRETTRESGIFEGSVSLEKEDQPPTPSPNDGRLQSMPGEVIEVVNDEYAGDGTSSDTALIRFASAEFVDEAGEPTSQVLENGVARLRVVASSPGSSITATVTSNHGEDQEHVTLTETFSGSQVYEGTAQLFFVPPGNGSPDSGALDASNSGAPDYLGDGLTVTYQDAEGTAVTIPSQVTFFDSYGQVTSTFAVGERVGVRVQDHNLKNPTIREQIQVTVREVGSGDAQSVYLTETGYGTDVYEGTLATAAGPPVSGDGTLQVAPGRTIAAERLNENTPYPTVAQAVMSGASVVFVDAQGQAAEVYFEKTRAYVRVSDTFASGSITATVRSFLAADSESLSLTETGPSTGVFEGSIALATDTANPNNGTLETGRFAGPPQELDTLTASYESIAGTVSGTVGTVGSRTSFIDMYGNETDSYAAGSTARVRVRDHNFDQPAVNDTVEVTVRSLSTGDVETVTVYQVVGEGVFETFVPLDREPSPVPNDGSLQSMPGEEIEVVHTDLGGGSTSSDRATIRYSEVLILDPTVDGEGEVLENGLARIQVTDTAAGSVSSTVVRSRYAEDEETVFLSPWGQGVYQGTVQLAFVAPGGATPDNGVLETSNSGAPEYLQDELTAEHMDAEGRAVTVPSRIGFLGWAEDWPVTEYAVGSTIRVRVQDQNANDPGQVDTTTALVTSPGGDAESITLTEIYAEAGIFWGLVPSSDTPGAPQDGTLTIGPNTLASVEHQNVYTPRPTTAQVPFNGNFAPDAVADSVETEPEQTVVIDVLANDTDRDNEPLEVAWVWPGAHGSAGIVDNKVDYTPDPGFVGTDTFHYVASDPRGGQSRGTVTVTVVQSNTTPVANDDFFTMDEDGAPLQFDVVANDTDGDNDPLEVTFLSEPPSGTAELQPDGTVLYTPAPNANGDVSFSYQVSDPSNAFDYGLITVTVNPVNDPPAANDDTLQVEEDGNAFVFVLDNDGDIDNDPLDILSVTQGTNGTVALNEFDDVTYTPNANFHGTDSFTYTVSDGNGGTDTATVTVTIAPSNDNLTAVDDSATVAEDGSVTVTVLGNDSDPENDVLSVQSVTQGTNGSVAIVGTQVTYTPNADFHGADSFTYTASDRIEGGGGTDSATVTVTVTPVNDAPVAGDDTASVVEDGSVAVTVLGNDADADDDLLSVTAVTQGAHGAVVINGDDTVTYTPEADYNGADSFTYTVSDGESDDTATVTVTVGAANDAPAANNDSASTSEDNPVTVSVLGNDTDPENDTLTVSAVTQGAHGTVTLNPVTYTPAANYNGSDSFTYTVSDGNGGTDTATVNVTIASANDAPAANDDTAAVAEDGSVIIPVLANDTDLDNDTLTVISVTQPANGTVTMNPVTYTPNANFFGANSFTYTVSDGNGGTDTATVTVTVTAVNDAPVAVNDTATTTAEVPVTIQVRTNDTDVEGNTLTITSVTQGAHGTVTINAGQTVTYTPATAWVGPDTFTYTISDGAGGTATATVNVTVQAPARVSANIQVLYAFDEGSGTTVNDTSGVGTPLNLTVANASAVTWLPGALSINSNTLVQSAGTATKVINASEASNEVTVEAWVDPLNLSQTGPAAIVTMSQNHVKRNVTLGQSGTAYNGQLRTSTTGQGGTQHSASNVATTNLTHVVYTRSSTGAVRIYVNGNLVTNATLTGNLSGWANYNLALGGELSGTRYWRGELHLVAIYSRALTAAEARQNWLAGAN